MDNPRGRKYRWSKDRPEPSPEEHSHCEDVQKRGGSKGGRETGRGKFGQQGVLKTKRKLQRLVEAGLLLSRDWEDGTGESVAGKLMRVDGGLQGCGWNGGDGGTVPRLELLT